MFLEFQAQTKGLSIADVGIVMSALPMAQIVFGVAFSYLVSNSNLYIIIFSKLMCGD